MTQLYKMFCSYCHWTKLTDGSDLSNFTEVITCKDCSGGRKFKCPTCGRLVRTTKHMNVQPEYIKYLDDLKKSNAKQEPPAGYTFM